MRSWIVLLIFSLISLLFWNLLVDGKEVQETFINVSLEKSFWIPGKIIPRLNKVPIANPYGIKNSCSRKDCGDFHLVIYYKNPYEALVLVRRLDAYHWHFNLSIFIENLSNTSLDKERDYLHEVINIGSSKTFQSILVITTSLLLYPDQSVQQKQIIPKRIIQTFSSRLPSNWFQWMARKTFEELNPEYELLMFNDIDCRQFLKQHFSNYILSEPSSPRNTFLAPMTFLDAYDRLISTTFKADLFRYAYLVVNGGCYFDHKMIARKPLRSVIFPNDTLLLCSDALPDRGLPPLTLETTQRLYNAIICSEAQDFRLWKTIDYVFRQILSKHQSGSDLSLTGPMAFYEAISGDIKDENLRFSHGFYAPLSSRRRRAYEDFYVKEKLHQEIFITKTYYDYDPGSPHLRYGKLWSKGIIYFDILLYRLPWKLYVFPHQTRCVKVMHDDTFYDRYLYLQAIALSSQEPDFELLQICRLIRLVIVHDDTSETWRMEIPFHDILNRQGQGSNISFDHYDAYYRIPFLFS